MLNYFFGLRSCLNNTVLIIAVVGVVIGNHGNGGVTRFPNHTWHETHVCVFACMHTRVRTHTQTHSFFIPFHYHYYGHVCPTMDHKGLSHT